MHTDFTKKLFNTRVENCIAMLLQQLDTPQFFTTNLLTDLLLEFKRYYKEEQPDDYKTAAQANARASEVLSEFLQYLVGHVARSSLAKLHIYRVIAHLLNHSLFHYHNLEGGSPPKMMVWQDPQNGNSVMHHLAYLDDADDMRNNLSLIEKHYGSKTAAGYRAILTQTNKLRYSLLSIACQTGSVAAVALLLEVAKDAYEIEDSDGFRAFLNHKTQKQLSSLNLAVAAGNEKIVFLLLQAAIKAFSGITSSGFRAFLAYSNQSLFSPLNQATYKADLAIVKLLLDTAEQAYQGYEVEYKNFIDHKNKFGLSPFAVACQQGSDPHRSIAILLLKHRADLDIKNSQNLSAQLMAPPHWDFLMPKLEEPKRTTVAIVRRVVVKKPAVTHDHSAQPCHGTSGQLRSVTVNLGLVARPNNKRLRHEALMPKSTKQQRTFP